MTEERVILPPLPPFLLLYLGTSKATFRGLFGLFDFITGMEGTLIVFTIVKLLEGTVYKK